MSEIQAINEYYYQTTNNYPQLSNKQQLLILNSDNDVVDTPNSLLYQNFCKMDIKEISPTTQNINETIFEEDLSIIIDDLANHYFEVVNKGREENIRKKF